METTKEFFDDATHYAYALGYWQGRSIGQFENDQYESMGEKQQHAYKCGYDAGVADYSTIDLHQEERLLDRFFPSLKDFPTIRGE